MYCPSCGNELTAELVYCNRCGANLRPLANRPETSGKMVGLTWAIATAITLVSLGGFGLIFALAITLINKGINLSGGGMMLIVVFFLVILAIAGLLTRQLSRVLDLSELMGGAPSARKTQPAALTDKPIPQISSPREPVDSVTDHTTQMFEPVHKERDTKR